MLSRPRTPACDELRSVVVGPAAVMWWAVMWTKVPSKGRQWRRIQRLSAEVMENEQAFDDRR